MVEKKSQAAAIERAEIPQAGPSSRRTGSTRIEMGAALTRVGSTHSAHAGQSLRRMATHETGEYAVDDIDPSVLDTHHEDHEHDSEHGHGQGSEHAPDCPRNKDEVDVVSLQSEKSSSCDLPVRNSGKADGDGRNVQDGTACCARVEEAAGGDKDAAGGAKGKFELQDQTNLLPLKQVIIVFVGLSCSLFCALLDQTM